MADLAGISDRAAAASCWRWEAENAGLPGGVVLDEPATAIPRLVIGARLIPAETQGANAPEGPWWAGERSAPRPKTARQVVVTRRGLTWIAGRPFPVAGGSADEDAPGGPIGPM